MKIKQPTIYSGRKSNERRRCTELSHKEYHKEHRVRSWSEQSDMRLEKNLQSRFARDLWLD